MVKRRTFLTVGAGLLGAGLLARPRAVGGPHTPYHQALGQTLRRAGVDRPVLVVDLDRLDHNVDLVMRSVAVPPVRTWRVVAKSVPSPALLEYVARRANTQALMVFHRPFLSALVAQRPQADFLLGKPLPVAAAARFYADHQGTAPPNVQWLVDTPARLTQYLELARGQNLLLNVSLEIDVGLHRGGLLEPQDLAPVLAVIQQNPQHLRLSGLMGYDAHLMGVPSLLAPAEIAAVKRRYTAFVDVVRAQQPAPPQQPLCFNGAGSPTFRNYEGDPLVNDVAAGTCLVKPSKYDIPSLAEFLPAAFIATPVLKRLDGLRVPTLEWSAGLLRAWNPNLAQLFFTYGGNWMANPESPPGLITSDLYRSSNQQGFYGSTLVSLDVDDFVFLRPTQSEAVLLQFGDLLAVRGGEVVERWPVLQGPS